MEKEKYVIYPCRQKDGVEQARATGFMLLPKSQLKKLIPLFKVKLMKDAKLEHKHALYSDDANRH